MGLLSLEKKIMYNNSLSFANLATLTKQCAT
jgi:hypothetical protein